MPGNLLERRVSLDTTAHPHDTDGGAPAHARRMTLDFLADAAPATVWPRQYAVMADAALLVVSELVTNAVRHAPGPCVLSLAVREGCIDIEVSDSSSLAPRFREPDLTAGSGGWGWRLVHMLCSEVHVMPEGPCGGKTVHARVRR
ncbi:ATP-binding protein [Streptomyces sp. ISL-10]|uniref:ATP-binding protein n=1 Tax=Streptomyces sp. ISL-10 TaxID=2819172 RepID=UPI001BE7C0EB|nr:ATP-binding protein [Streptomyces sp. ISL-10]MBT2365680.1 ATP-binding protein [Streptomyces sp. ISL-10]